MKITMIGKSGSGKTTYMCALHEVFSSNRVDGFYITPSANNFEDSIRNAKKFESLSFESRNYQFPPGTQKTTLWSFDLFNGNELISNFEWIDYRGGILEDIFNQESEGDERELQEEQELLGHLVASNAVFLFADSVILTSYPEEKERRKRSGAEKINKLLRHYSVHYRTRKLSFVIVLTKADSDLIDEKYKRNNYSKLIELGGEAFSEVWFLLKENRRLWHGGIVAIGSVGEGKVKSTSVRPANFRNSIEVKTEIIGYPDPINVFHPIFFCLGHTLANLQQAVEDNISQCDQEVRRILDNSSTLREFWSALTNKKTSRDIVNELREKREDELYRLSRIAPRVRQLCEIAREKVVTI